MISDFLKLSLNNLRRRRLRSLLTMLGIFIGIAAVVSLISLGQGLQDSINQQFEKLGKDKILIQTKTLGPPGSATSKSLILTSKDLDVVKNTRGVEWAGGLLIKTGQAKFKGQTKIGFTIGIDVNEIKEISRILNTEVVEGRNLRKGDKYKIVVGYNHAYGDIWKRGIKIGEKIEIENTEFNVVGIYEKIGNPYDDGALYVPKETLKNILDSGDEESEIIAKTQERFNPKDVREEIIRKLRGARGEKEGQETFNVQTSEQLFQTFTNIFGIVQAVLVGIAGISLLVGGIGIMNTMYTSVLERTKEIGTMKAIGATNNQIKLLFLFESGLLGLVGGAIGVGLGIGLAKSAEYIAISALGTNLLKASLNPLTILGALAFSFVIGTLSGLLPATQASNLKPVDALRYE